MQIWKGASVSQTKVMCETIYTEGTTKVYKSPKRSDFRIFRVFLKSCTVSIERFYCVYVVFSNLLNYVFSCFMFFWYLKD